MGIKESLSSKAVAFLFLCLSICFHANGSEIERVNILDDLNPFDRNIQEQLEQLDQEYESETGLSPFQIDLFAGSTSCYRSSCTVWAQVSRRQQKMQIFLNGNLYATWLVSTGAIGYETPNFDRHPNGRIYDAYNSKKYPGGDYKGLGNMPYAVFIYEGFAIHGTGRANWAKLGSAVSHGCVRLHPDNAYLLNRLVRQYGIANTWITVND